MNSLTAARLLKVFFFGLAVVPTSKADTISLQPVADTTLQATFPDSNFGDGTTFTVGGRRHGGRTRALMLFDIANNLPAGATITSASLTVTVIGVPSGGVNSTFDLNRLTASWGEGSGTDHGGSPAGAGAATWNNRQGSSGSAWTTPGGDFVAAASASRAINGSGGFTFTSTTSLVGDVQSWLNNPANNFGWLMRSESETTATTIRRFASRDDSANSPLLTINYTLVPEPGTCALLALGVGAVAWAARHRRGHS
jgi:hypothetical protein